LRRLPDGRRYIDAIAENLIRRALSGDIAAIQMIGDRLDGAMAKWPAPLNRYRCES
jgi:hypothetical protein